MQLIEYTGIQSLIIDSLALYTNSEYFQCRVHFRPIPSAQRSHGAEKVYIAKTRLASLVGLPDSNGEGSTETGDHESPVAEKEELGKRVEGDVRARALSVVVRAAELGAGGGKATTGDERGGHSGPQSGSGVHLEESNRARMVKAIYSSRNWREE